ncbi:MAG: hypothetical protein A3J10_04265 [Candidatus Sungbacteria bacterium RIFCSPLOWO2_02_FULL_54_10]|uniref:HD domain-containing protein n=2 Tax=Candidatus Sungiibacteriota TaxID=1817917 RepID=A0A1G2L5A8_9BACT|nr:MAG: hypothetical protein A2679_02465 [Candidatus Sungbacteria bacterium RIFCSPHIGHO2_01_FULL_54_26]OHA03751.1 MAG: hypothetical protein A3C92_00115 [Candidatus Sungbacteria bacterium RIFCSPHIGHO2_02_FULL_53_17]OHA06823.1 MAG: hypothetical protein A3B34_02650 [Candidatus Sungbacteria bacterium RIFCSPLOWO2_01_FULL_54_21]OHA13095.1 MAG: hypothetical protein A3J10_04265 [Candidatus Sungbacteria bacterium RIFCSPLOWO2_02_FULL_54_10]
MGKQIHVPKEVAEIIARLDSAGYQAYPVGGSVRDMLSGARPKDWDVTTSAKPEEITSLFPGSFYENKFLTVTVKTGSEDSALKEVEVTTFRAEGKYTDKRHPDEVRFADTLEEDLGRRDFTINAMALNIGSHKASFQTKSGMDSTVIDPFGGQEDLQRKIIRAVGDPAKRFSEDALRMMRAVRLATELEFVIEEKTQDAIAKHAGNLRDIAGERIRDELIKIVDNPRAGEGVRLLQKVGLLSFIIPELEEGIGAENRPRVFTIWEHNLKAFEYGVHAGFATDVRIAALLHDVAKPATKGPEKNGEWTFYGHDVVGGKMAAKILTRLHFPRDTVDKVATLIRWHLFKYDPDEGITDSSVRRLIRRVGAEHMNDLVKVRICDRMGMGVPKALPYRLRHFQFRVEKILREEEAPTPKQLKVNGGDVMQVLGSEPGPTIGRVLEVLLQEVIDDPAKNNREQLMARIGELGQMPDEELVRIAEASESKIEISEDERISSIKAKYHVK